MWESVQIVRDPIRIGSSIYRKSLSFQAALQAGAFTAGIAWTWTFCLHLSILRNCRVLGGKPMPKQGLFFSEKSLNSSIVLCTLVWKVRKEEIIFPVLLHSYLYTGQVWLLFLFESILSTSGRDSLNWKLEGVMCNCFRRALLKSCSKLSCLLQMGKKKKWFSHMIRRPLHWRWKI